uniref:Transmembrane protein 1 n=1 Tax=Ganoderma boninense TaxID=34458 RepID=A0A5K1K486_9APHY|nr:Transmembrane protein 1 [Ganoderma boninense]
MSFGGFDDTTPGWGVPTPSTGDIVTNAIRKEKLIKEIIAAQEDLRAMMSKTKGIQTDVDKLISGNETLQMYIDNLTMQMAKRR